MEKTFCIFEENKFDTIKDQINLQAGYPKDSTYYKDGIVNIPGTGTIDYILPIQHPTENKGYIEDNQNRPSEIDTLIQNNCNYKLTLTEMIEQGFLPSMP